MKSAVKRIGVLTSGGDAPGMNAAIRSVVRASMHMGIECLGIRRGFNGLITGDITSMDFVQTSGLIGRGGTVLYTQLLPSNPAFAPIDIGGEGETRCARILGKAVAVRFTL